jgi:hypothetical protein
MIATKQRLAHSQSTRPRPLPSFTLLSGMRQKGGRGNLPCGARDARVWQIAVEFTDGDGSTWAHATPMLHQQTKTPPSFPRMPNLRIGQDRHVGEAGRDYKSLSCSLSSRLARGEPTKIMPLGDSITEGDSRLASHRWHLWNLLRAAGYKVDFVGSVRPDPRLPPIPPDYDFDPEYEDTADGAHSSCSTASAPKVAA